MLDIAVLGINTAQREIRVMGERVQDFTQAWDSVIDTVIDPAIERQFETEGDGRWQPRKDDLPHPLLQKTGKLRRSYTGDGEGHIEERRRDGLLFGSDVEYADFIEDGTSRMPARPVLDFIDEQFSQDVAHALDNWLSRGIR